MDKRALVLVVDDAAPTLRLCVGLLGEQYDVRLAKSGKMAMVALKRMRPDVILLDIEMPDMTGFEIMLEIKKDPSLKDIPVIFVTSHANEKLVVKAAEYGAVDYVVKPFNPDALRRKIQKAVNGNAR